MSLASGIIKLAPVRMGDLTSAATAATAATESYLAPHLRAASASQKQQEQPKMDATNFPSLGAKPTPVKSVWNKVEPTVINALMLIPTLTTLPAVISLPVVIPNFKATVDAYLEKERLSEAERNKQPETDINKMTKEELEADGWITLSLNRAAVIEIMKKHSPVQAPECCGNFSFTDMSTLCQNYEKRVVREMNVYRPKGSKV